MQHRQHRRKRMFQRPRFGELEPPAVHPGHLTRHLDAAAAVGQPLAQHVERARLCWHSNGRAQQARCVLLGLPPKLLQPGERGMQVRRACTCRGVTHRSSVEVQARASSTPAFVHNRVRTSTVTAHQAQSNAHSWRSMPARASSPQTAFSNGTEFRRGGGRGGSTEFKTVAPDRLALGAGASAYIYRPHYWGRQ